MDNRIYSLIRGFHNIHSWLEEHGSDANMLKIIENNDIPEEEIIITSEWHVNGKTIEIYIDEEFFKKGFLLGIWREYLLYHKDMKNKKWFKDPLTEEFLTTEDAYEKYINNEERYLFDFRKNV